MMKYIYVFLIFYSSSVFSDGNSIDFSKKIIGTWTCSWLIQEDNNVIDLEIETQYVRNERFNASGIVKYDVEDKNNKDQRIKLDYNLAMSGSWKIEENKYLISVIDEVKTINLTNPIIDQLLDLDRFFPTGISSSSEIINISSETITTKEEGSDDRLECKKKKNKSELNKIKDSEEVIYIVMYNDDGAILKNTKGEVIYAGKSCDTFSKDFGGGKWGYANNGIIITLGNKVLSFPSQKIKLKGCEL